jgi:long-chain acyl-CoA synthetase
LLQVTTVKAFHFVVNPPLPGDIYLGYLPLAHILELLSEFTMIVQGIPVGYSSPNTMIDKSTKVRCVRVDFRGQFLKTLS